MACRDSSSVLLGNLWPATLSDEKQFRKKLMSFLVLCIMYVDQMAVYTIWIMDTVQNLGTIVRFLTMKTSFLVNEAEGKVCIKWNYSELTNVPDKCPLVRECGESSRRRDR